MRRHLTLVVLLCVVGSLFAELTYKGTLTLNDGSKLSGEITEDNERYGETVYLVFPGDGSVHTVLGSNVSSVNGRPSVKESTSGSLDKIKGIIAPKKGEKTSKTIKKKMISFDGELTVKGRISKYDRGFKNVIGIEITPNNLINLGLSYTAGFQLNPNIFLGAGVRPTLVLDNGITLPIFVEGRWNITRTTVSPFVQARLGYDVVAASYWNAFNVGVDFKMGYKRRSAFYIMLGVALDQGYVSESYPYTTSSSYYPYTRTETRYRDYQTPTWGFNAGLGFRF